MTGALITRESFGHLEMFLESRQRLTGERLEIGIAAFSALLLEFLHIFIVVTEHHPGVGAIKLCPRHGGEFRYILLVLFIKSGR